MKSIQKILEEIVKSSNPHPERIELLRNSLKAKLAKLSNEFGPPGETILLYKLALKHVQKKAMDTQVRSEFDSVAKNDVDLYVPLQQYYELVAFRKEIDTLRPPQGVLLNMGALINSDREDYGPTIGNADNVLLFTSKRNRHADPMNKSYNEDLFYTIKEGDAWTWAEAFRDMSPRYQASII